MRPESEPTLAWLAQVKSVGIALARAARARPFTSAVTIVIVVTAIFTGLPDGPYRSLRLVVGTGYEPVTQSGRWWTLLVSYFFTANLAEFIVAVVLVVALVGIAEGLMGPWRTALAFLATAITGTALGIAVQGIAASVGELWARNVVELVALDPFTPIAGTIMAASAFASTLWRRRIRWLTVLICLVYVLYDGQPSDLYRFFAAGAGLALGVVLHPGVRAETWVRSSQHEVRVLMGSVVAITAAGPAIALFSGSRFGPLAPVALLIGNDVPDAGQALRQCRVLDATNHCLHELTLERINSPGSVLVSVIPLVVLLLAAYGLTRGRRFAWGIAVAINAALGVLGIFYFGLLPIAGVPYMAARTRSISWELGFSLLVSILMPLAIAVALLIVRTRFPILTSRRILVRYLVTLPVSAFVLAALYVGIGTAMGRTGFTVPVTYTDLLADVAERFIPVAFLHRETISFLPADPVTSALYYGIGPLFWVIVLLAAIRPTLGAYVREETADAARIRAMLHAGGGDALSFMATWPGNSYWFDPVEPFAVAYRVAGRVALTTGGPFGSHSTKERTIGRFARFCDDHGWIPVFYSVEGALAPVFRSIGWSTMVVAEETIIRPELWRTVGKKWQDVRTSINRAQRAGINAVWATWEALPLTTVAQIAEINEQWVAEKDLPEMGFTLGGIDELRDPAVRLMLALDESGRVEAVTSWLPSYRDGAVIGWTLDFMRRRPGSTPGTMEFLIAETATLLRENGIEFMSLSGSPLAHTASLGQGASGIDRLLGYLSSSLEPVYGFRSLLAFKRKFQPEFRPLIMAYPDQSTLPAIGLALTRAYLPNLSLRQVTRLLRSDVAGTQPVGR